MALSDAHLQILFFQSVLKCERFIAAVVTEPDFFGASSLAHFFSSFHKVVTTIPAICFWVVFFYDKTPSSTEKHAGQGGAAGTAHHLKELFVTKPATSGLWSRDAAFLHQLNFSSS